MRAASLLIVLIAAKALMLAGHPLTWSWWSPVAYLWQDAVVALLFGALEYAARRHAPAAWAGYGVAALYVAANIPVARVLSTPLTWPMLRAAGGPLADSIGYYLTWGNALLFLAVAAVAAVAPLLMRHVRWAPLAASLAVLVALGPSAAARVDTRGLERNAWTALIRARVADPGTRAAGGYRAGLVAAAGRDLRAWRGSAKDRNIILVSLESTGAQYLGLYGTAPDPMPNLSRLARNAVVFENAYAVYPESIKGLFSILCAAYPAFASEGDDYARVPCRSLAAGLRAAGYRTAMFHSGRFRYLGMEAVIRDRGFEILEDGGAIGGDHQSSFGVDEPSTVRRVLSWIDGLKTSERFFVAYLPIAGHHPYEAPGGGPFADREEIGRYRNALAYGDRALGTLMDGLRARGLEEKTVWVVLGDHGEAFGQHDGNYGHTFQLYEENVHVPFLVAAPGRMAGQVRAPQVVSLVDTAPTVLELAGLPVPADYQGQSMLTRDARMALFFADYSLGLVGLRDGERKFVYQLNSRHAQWFDLERDSAERVNRVAEHRPESAWYERKLTGWIAAQQEWLRKAR